MPRSFRSAFVLARPDAKVHTSPAAQARVRATACRTGVGRADSGGVREAGQDHTSVGFERRDGHHPAGSGPAVGLVQSLPRVVARLCGGGERGVRETTGVPKGRAAREKKQQGRLRKRAGCIRLDDLCVLPALGRRTKRFNRCLYDRPQSHTDRWPHRSPCGAARCGGLRAWQRAYRGARSPRFVGALMSSCAVEFNDRAKGSPLNDGSPKTGRRVSASVRRAAVKVVPSKRPDGRSESAREMAWMLTGDLDRRWLRRSRNGWVCLVERLAQRASSPVWQLLQDPGGDVSQLHVFHIETGTARLVSKPRGLRGRCAWPQIADVGFTR